MKKKIILFLLILASFLFLSGCETSSEKKSGYVISAQDTIIYAVDEPIELNRIKKAEFISIKKQDDSLQDILEIKNDSIRLLQLMIKKEEDENLKRKEEKELVKLQFEVRQKSTNEHLEQLKQQHIKIDSLLKNK